MGFCDDGQLMSVLISPDSPARAHGPRVVRAPRGSVLSCKSWQQEAALRMLMNNLDPEVAERPDDLVVYGGTGRAARSWEAFDAIVDALRRLENDETLLVQSGKPVGVFRTHAWSPRVLIANSNLVGRWANWDYFRELERPVRRHARRSVRAHGGPWRHGRRPAARRDDERRGDPRHRRRRNAHRQARRDRVLRSEDTQPRRGGRVDS
jgi:hypothetical protein